MTSCQGVLPADNLVTREQPQNDGIEAVVTAPGCIDVSASGAVKALSRKRTLAQPLYSLVYRVLYSTPANPFLANSMSA